RPGICLTLEESRRISWGIYFELEEALMREQRRLWWHFFRTSRPRQGRTFRPLLESLEDRRVPALAVVAQQFNMTEGVSASPQVAPFTSNDDFLPDFTATIDWGDGTSSQGTITQEPISFPFTMTVSGTHTYVGEGTYSVTVTVDNSDTGETASDTTTA